MGNLQERLDQLRTRMQDPDFLTGRGLSNEVNIQIFCYHAEEELAVQQFVQQLKRDTALSCRPMERNLYQIFLDICADFDILDAIPEMEEADGGDNLLEELHGTVRVEEFITKMQYDHHQRGQDVLILTGVGDVFPFMRVHSLLEAMQREFSDIPILVLYPGQFDGYHLKLFDRLQPNDYYRGFNLI